VHPAGFYRYVEEESLIAPSPAVYVRRPRLDYKSHAIGLDRNEVGALLVAAGLGPAAEHALVSLLALNRLRVSSDIEALGVRWGHRTLEVLRKTVTIPRAGVGQPGGGDPQRRPDARPPRRGGRSPPGGARRRRGAVHSERPGGPRHGRLDS